MKTTVTFFSLILASNFAFAHGITESKYIGGGLWKSADQRGTYKTSVMVEKSRFSTTYFLADGSVKEWSFETKDTPNGFFDVISQNMKIGSGYCLEKAEVQLVPHRLE
ncbi:MAG: hypothetical protein AB7H97_09685 [Pseudobdellovibrionaceae bacterium]